jgi:hypothetical protein
MSTRWERSKRVWTRTRVGINSAASSLVCSVSFDLTIRIRFLVLDFWGCITVVMKINCAPLISGSAPRRLRQSSTTPRAMTRSEKHSTMNFLPLPHLPCDRQAQIFFRWLVLLGFIPWCFIPWLMDDLRTDDAHERRGLLYRFRRNARTARANVAASWSRGECLAQRLPP